MSKQSDWSVPCDSVSQLVWLIVLHTVVYPCTMACMLKDGSLRASTPRDFLRAADWLYMHTR